MKTNRLNQRTFFYLLLTSLILLVFLYYGKKLPFTPLEESRLATIESLANGNGFVINDSLFVGTVDKVLIDGNFISTKPPVLSTLGALLVKIEQFFLPWSFTAAFISFGLVNVYYYSLLIIFVILPFGLAVYLAERLLLQWDIKYRYFLLSIFTFFSLWFVYLWRFTNHVITASFLFIGIYFYLIKNKPTPRLIFLSGLFLSAAVVFELSVIVWYLVLLFLWWWRERSRVVWYIVGSIPFFALHLFLSFISSGSLWPVYLRTSLYQYPGSYWLRPQGIDNLHQPKLLYLFNLLLGTHGLFFYTPVYLFSLIGLGRALRDKKFKISAILTIVGLLVFVLFYWLKTSNYGGVAYGLRWFIVLIPILWLWFVYYFYQQQKLSWILLSAIAWSLLAVIIGILNPLLVQVEVVKGINLFFPWLAGVWRLARFFRF